jgi:ankyrin repeat protein
MREKTFTLIALFLVLVFSASASAGEIHIAASLGDVEIVKKLLDKDPKFIDQIGELNLTPLMHACKTDQKEVVDLLIKRGADVNKACDEWGYMPQTPLSVTDDIEIAKMLLKAGADVNAADPDFNMSPLYHAMSSDNDELAKLLIAHGAKVTRAMKNADEPEPEVEKFNHAIESGNLKVVSEMIEKDPELINLRSQHMTPLFRAASAKRTGVAMLLIEKGADVNAVSYGDGGHHGRSTPLHMACLRCNKPLTEALINKGANPNAEEVDFSATPLFYATLACSPEIAYFLIEHGADPETSKKRPPCIKSDELGYAIGNGKIEGVKQIIKEHPECVNADGYFGMIPLSYAAQENKPEIVKELLSAGANPNYAGMMPPPIYYVACSGDMELVKALIASGADPSGVRPYSEPLICALDQENVDMAKYLIGQGAKVRPEMLLTATENGRADSVRLLLENGADPNVRDAHSQPMWDTPLHKAANGGHLEIVKMLLDKGADPNLYNADRETALFAALQTVGSKQVEEIVELLIEHGADIKHQSSSKRTPLVAAANFNHHKAVDLLILSGADANASDSSGITALHYAAYLGNEEMIKSLIAAGAKRNVKDEQGRLPIDMAKEMGQAGAVELLE